MNEEANMSNAESDAPAVEVRRVTKLEAVTEAASLFDKPIDEAAAEKFLAADGHHLLLAYESATPVGMVTGVEMTHPDKGTEMFAYELGVDEAYRGRGIGSQLVRALTEIARQRGCYGMWTLTGQDNAAAHAAYERAGGKREDAETMFAWEL
jgi:ribosomal protein S18 acetylase RimI-like enzyme